MGWFGKSRLSEREAVRIAGEIKAKSSGQCEHKHWRAHGWNTVGQCACVDCGAILFVDDALNATVERLEALERRIDEKLRYL